MFAAILSWMLLHRAAVSSFGTRSVIPPTPLQASPGAAGAQPPHLRFSPVSAPAGKGVGGKGELPDSLARYVLGDSQLDAPAPACWPAFTLLLRFFCGMGCLKFPLFTGISETPLERGDGGRRPAGPTGFARGAKPRAPCRGARLSVGSHSRAATRSFTRWRAGDDETPISKAAGDLFSGCPFL